MLRRLLLVALGTSACSSVDVDLLGQRASPCDLGDEVGTWQAITPPEIQYGADPGVTSIVMDPYDASVLYAGTNHQGVWRTADCGATWTRTNTGINGPILEGGSVWKLALDRVAPDTLYTDPRYTGNGLWWSTNAGVHWEMILPNEVGAMVTEAGYADVAWISVDPGAPHHVIATSIQPWIGTDGASGVYEGRYDEGAQTWRWTIHPPAPGMGTSQVITMLDARTWILSSPWVPSGEGTWRTIDAGASFQKVDDAEGSVPGTQLYESPTGTLFLTSQSGLLRSTDRGASWTDVFVGLSIGGTQAVTGDGDQLLVSTNVPDTSPRNRLYAAPENPGDRAFAPFRDLQTTFNADGFVRDTLRDVIYTHDDFTGVYRMRLR